MATKQDFIDQGFNSNVAEALEGKEFSIEQALTMSEYELFDALLTWNGIIGYSLMIRDGLDNIRNMEAI